MNPDESVENIKLVPIESEDELKGLTIEYEFYNTAVSPPHKYLSESHLNCLGLAFFLASVEAFNKVNKFFILDDVISSFDSNHRKRFLDLLAEKFNDYQIILLTHERNFFEYARMIAKAKGWKVDSFKYSKEKGSYLAQPQKTVYERIIQKLTDGDEEKLAHDVRIYLEHLLKEIASCIEAKVSFRYNDINEDRMSPELLNEIKSRLTKSSKGIGGLLEQSQVSLNRTLASNFIGNKDSHDSDYIPSLGDCKAFWNDVIEIESKFKCPSCSTIINKKFYSTESKEIKCRCGKLKYAWAD
jgi:energy-coupling factor transporter ATP-binding protein EcfA2